MTNRYAQVMNLLSPRKSPSLARIASMASSAAWCATSSSSGRAHSTSDRLPGGERGAPRRVKAVARVHEAAAAGRGDNVHHDVRQRVAHDSSHDPKNMK